MSWQDIEGRAAYLWIYDEFLKQAPHGACIVEVGVALGKSVAYAASKCIELKRHDVRIYAVDPFGGYARNGEQQKAGPPTPDGDYHLFEASMREHAPEERARINLLRLTSLEAATCFARRTWRLPHLVVLDADHTFEAVRDDIEAWRAVLAPGGWIGGDDYEEEAFPGVIRAVKECFGPLPVEVRREQDWGTWLVRNGE